MRTWAGWLGAVVVLAAVIAGCADRPGGGSASDASTGTGGTRPAEAVSVRLVVSGGIAGSREVFEVRRDATPAGMTSTEVDRALALATSRPVRDFSAGRMRGPGQCCDLRQLEITVAYADGTRTRLRTYETASQPPEVSRLVALMASSR